MVSSDIIFSKMDHNHWPAVESIYRAGIAGGQATFETESPQWAVWDKYHIKECRIVAIIDTQVVGWAALSSVSNRKVYRGVMEVSVYVAPEHQKQNIGKLLLKELIEQSETAGIWTLQACIFPENESSIKLHKRLGFRQVGFREKIGKLNGQWHDVILLERRSKQVNP